MSLTGVEKERREPSCDPGGELLSRDAERRSVIDGLGIRIREAREEAGIQMTELAEMIGISPSYLSKIETEKAVPPLRHIEKMARCLDVNALDLLSDYGIEAKLQDMLPRIIPEISEDSLRRLLKVSPSQKRDLLRIADSLIRSLEEKPTATEAHIPPSSGF